MYPLNFRSGDILCMAGIFGCNILSKKNEIFEKRKPDREIFL